MRRRAWLAASAGAAALAGVLVWSLRDGAALGPATCLAAAWLAVPVAAIAWAAARDPVGATVLDRALATWQSWLLLLLAVVAAIAVYSMPPLPWAAAGILREAALLVRPAAPIAFAIALVPVVLRPPGVPSGPEPPC